MDILRRLEQTPASYPPVPEGLSPEAAAIPAAAIWARIEAYIAYRFSVRTVTWTVHGAGEFVPDLTPATITSEEVWDGVGYIPASLDAGFMGGVVLNGDGPYRITADVGGGEVPAAVNEAFIRLALYMADAADRAGVSSYSVKMDAIEESYQRNPAWMARAMQNSGAGDLLRPYRRA